jgi:DNA-binding transcriptional LysR family regulator
MRRVEASRATARELGDAARGEQATLSVEERLGVTLLHRTTRRISPTAEGEAYLAGARRILIEIEEVERQLTQSMAEPKGLLRVNATLGFGRNHVAPIVSRFCKTHPHVQLQLQLTVDPPPLNEDAFDVCVRFGEPPDARVIARRIASNRRLLCASPAYLKRRGTPRSPRDLVRHDCISIRHGGEAYGVWRLRSGKREEVVKVGGAVMTNDGDVAVQWALAGHGILMRAEWDLAQHLRSGRLKPVLETYQTPPADIYAVYPQRHQLSARVRAFVDFLSGEMGESVR